MTMEARVNEVHATADGDVMYCGVCHDPITHLVTILDHRDEPAPGGAGMVTQTYIADYIAVPCAHHGQAYSTRSGPIAMHSWRR